MEKERSTVTQKPPCARHMTYISSKYYVIVSVSDGQKTRKLTVLSE